jgi:hypothetical protein
MKPSIQRTKFGSIVIEREAFRHDVIIRRNGRVRKRKKRLSKAVYGTSHTISLEEAKYFYQKGADKVIIGTGQYGLVTLSEEASSYFKGKACEVICLPTPNAIRTWNEAEGAVIGLFHVTC